MLRDDDNDERSRARSPCVRVLLYSGCVVSLDEPADWDGSCDSATYVAIVGVTVVAAVGIERPDDDDKKASRR